MIRTQIYIPDELYKEAKLYAQTEKKSISEYIREGLEIAIKRKKSEQKKKPSVLDLAGKYRYPGKKKTNAAATHNDIYDL